MEQASRYRSGSSTYSTRDKFAFAIGSSTADGLAGPLDTSEDQIQLVPLHAYSSSNLLWEALHLYYFKSPGLVYSVNDNEHGLGRRRLVLVVHMYMSEEAVES